MLRAEFDIDITDQRPRHWDTLSGRRFAYVISLCDRAYRWARTRAQRAFAGRGVSVVGRAI
ncbi:hypothetical protein [Micromonospora sp. RP3T]|uniref:hypothetical protein n=1 Tax=Micromonospora sp. RP3T TaxID=2135446 RepID=UPI003D7093C9